MPRPPRITEPGLVYHILNRRVMRLAIFRKDRDYVAFEAVLGEALHRPDAPRLLAEYFYRAAERATRGDLVASSVDLATGGE